MPREHRYKGFLIVSATRRTYEVTPCDFFTSRKGNPTLVRGTLGDVKRWIDERRMEEYRAKLQTMKTYDYRGFTIHRTGLGGFQEWTGIANDMMPNEAFDSGLVSYGRTLAAVKSDVDNYHEELAELRLNEEAIAVLDALANLRTTQS